MSSGRPHVAASGPRLVPLSLARLVGNGLFRFVYPFLAVVAVDVGLGDGAETLLITGLAVGGMLLPLASRAIVGSSDAPLRSTSTGLTMLFVGTLLLGGLAPLLAGGSATVGAVTAVGATVLLGLAKPLLDVGSMTYVSARVEWGDRGRALSIMELTWGGGLLVLGPAGLLAARIGWRPTLITLGGLGLLAVVLLRRWLDPDELTAALTDRVVTTSGAAAPGERHAPDGGRPPAGAGRRGSDVVETAATASAMADRSSSPADRPLARSRVLFLTAFGLGFVALESTFGIVGLWLESGRGVDRDLVATVVAIGSVGEIAGSLTTVFVADRLGKARTAMLGALSCAAGFLLLGSADPLWLAIVGLVIGLFGTETLIVAAIALGSEVDPARRARFLSLGVAWSSVARAVAGGGAALVLRELGIGGNTGISAVAALATVAALVALTRSDPRLRG